MEIYHLTNDTIDFLSDQVGELYESNGCTKKETMRAKLILEEALLKYQNRFGTEIEVYFRIYRVFSQTRFCLRLRAPSFDPFTLEENPMAFMIQTIMSSFEGSMPTWKYRNLENELVFTLRKKAKLDSLTKLAFAVVTAVILGIAARLLMSPESLNLLVNDYLLPLANAYSGLFCVMAVLMTIFGFTLSIVHIGDMASVGAMGGRLLKRFYLIMLLVVTVLALPMLPFFEMGGEGALSVAAKSIYDVLISFIPTNFVLPFLDFNSVHIMIIGLMFGFSLLVMGQSGETLVKFFDEGNLVAVYTNNFLNRFIAVYVALQIFAIITTSEFSRLAGAGKMILVILIGEFLILAFYTVYASIKTQTPIMKYIRTMMPPFLICLSSANMGTAFSTIYESIASMDVDGNTIGIAATLGSVVFQPGCAFMLVTASLFMANIYGVEISLIWVLMAILLSVILIAAVPNTPGAAVSVFTLLFTQLGLPAEALSMMIAINALLQFVTVSVDVWCLTSEIVCFDRSMKKKTA